MQGFTPLEIMKNYLGKILDDETENSINSNIGKKHFDNFKNDVRKKVEKMLSDNEESTNSEKSNQKDLNNRK